MRLTYTGMHTGILSAIKGILWMFFLLSPSTLLVAGVIILITFPQEWVNEAIEMWQAIPAIDPVGVFNVSAIANTLFCVLVVLMLLTDAFTDEERHRHTLRIAICSLALANYQVLLWLLTINMEGRDYRSVITSLLIAGNIFTMLIWSPWTARKLEVGVFLIAYLLRIMHAPTRYHPVAHRSRRSWTHSQVTRHQSVFLLKKAQRRWFKRSRRRHIA